MKNTWKWKKAGAPSVGLLQNERSLSICSFNEYLLTNPVETYFFSSMCMEKKFPGL